MRRGSLAVVVAWLVVAAPVSAQLFRRPVACDSCIGGWYYFDETAGGGTSDWNCGSSSYDGHRGADFSLIGGNGAIDAGHDVVAAADGVVRSTIDGFYDRCRSCPASGADPSCGLGFGGGFGNHVVVDHGSYTAVYAHMRTGSVRVAPGDRVTCGQVVGQIGSSGCSTGGHVHFETRPLAGGYLTAFDPYSGACSPRATSLWVSQGAHRSMPAPTCDGPLPPTCPGGWYDIWTCEGGARRRCIDGVTMVEECSPGSCESRAVGTDDVCDSDGDSYATDEADCDDRDASTHPGGTDTCGDGRDQDCSGGDEPCPESDAGQEIDAAASDGGPDHDAARPDGAVGADGAVPTRDAARADAAGDGGSGGRGSLSSNCGCGVPARRRDAHGALLVLATSAIARRRRRSAVRSGTSERFR